MTCNCPICYCARAPEANKPKKPCLFCLTGDEHGMGLKQHNRYRLCENCGDVLEPGQVRATARSWMQWPEDCPACGSSFGPSLRLGFDWLSEDEAQAPAWPTGSMVEGQRKAAFTRWKKGAK